MGCDMRKYSHYFSPLILQQLPIFIELAQALQVFFRHDLVISDQCFVQLPVDGVQLQGISCDDENWYLLHTPKNKSRHCAMHRRVAGSRFARILKP